VVVWLGILAALHLSRGMDCYIAATITTPTIDHRTDNTGDVHWQCIDTGRVKITISKRNREMQLYERTRRTEEILAINYKKKEREGGGGQCHGQWNLQNCSERSASSSRFVANAFSFSLPRVRRAKSSS